MDAGVEHEVPPAAAMMGLITGYWVSQAVGVVALLGVADQLGEAPRRSDELARAVGADPQACTGYCGCWPASASSQRPPLAPSR
jgi:hypothetical protein